MLLATPFVPEITDYKNLATRLKEKGNLLNHVHLIICEPEHEAEAYAWGEDVTDLFLKTSIKVLAPDQRTNAQRANDLFRSAVQFAASYQPAIGEVTDPALLYLDPTYRPSTPGWLDKIQADYYFNKAPMTYGQSTQDDEGAKIFQGPLVVSKEFGPASGLLDFVPTNIHYRTHLKWEFTKGSVESSLIGTGSSSVLRPQPIKK